MNSPVEEIKARLDIVELIQSYVRLQKAGMNYRAVCPFHTEKTPSFFVSPTRQMWHCFGGCSEGGDIFKFVMKIEGMDFPEALKLLAARSGVHLTREDPRIRSERNRLYDLCEEAAVVFEHALSRTPSAKAYLRKRGITEETTKLFRIGFAPQSWDFLLKALGAKGFEKPEIERAGLVIHSEDRSSWYDRFRSRIIFPIVDGSGRIIGFGGRIVDFDPQEKKNNSDRTEAKYINSPQTPIYDKSRVLYGLDKAKQAIREKNAVVVVEGYMDCVLSHQAGVTHTIAVSGTALTPQQLTALKRLTTTMISSFDTDAAGDSATKRSLTLASQFGFERKIAVIPSGKDPADTVLENPHAWREAVVHATSVVEFYFEKAFRDYDVSTPAGKKSIGSLVLPYIGELANEIEKAHWVEMLARRLGGIPQQSIWAELKKVRHEGGQALAQEGNNGESTAPVSRRSLIEERLLAIYPFVPASIRDEELRHRNISFRISTNAQIFAIMGGTAEEASIPEHLKTILELLAFKGEVLGQVVENIESEFRHAARELEKAGIREDLEDLSKKIASVEQHGGQDTAALLQSFRALSERLKTLL